MHKQLDPHVKWTAIALLLTAALAGTAAWYRSRYLGGKLITREPIDATAKLATWPWPNAVRELIRPGVMHWLDQSSPDGTVLDLFEFDFRRNPNLDFSLFDQDQDDAHPFDNQAPFWQRGVTAITQQLNRQGTGVVLAATNGPFFGLSAAGPQGIATHVAPVVIRGQPHFAGGQNPRWTVGVISSSHGPRFEQQEAPAREQLRRYTYASGGLQSLVRDGKLAPLPPGSVNHSIAFDRMRTTRVGLGWTRDSGKLYLLFVKEPDAEGPSLLAAEHGISIAGGWSVPDLARFFIALGAWGAVNSDAGDVGQLLYRTPAGRYILVPPKWTSPEMRMTLNPDLSTAPPGGTLLYWVIRERGVQKQSHRAQR
jgi:phosphodiester glycosidase